MRQVKSLGKILYGLQFVWFALFLGLSFISTSTIALLTGLFQLSLMPFLMYGCYKITRLVGFNLSQGLDKTTQSRSRRNNNRTRPMMSDFDKMLIVVRAIRRTTFGVVSAGIILFIGTLLFGILGLAREGGWKFFSQPDRISPVMVGSELVAASGLLFFCSIFYYLRTSLRHFSKNALT